MPGKFEKASFRAVKSEFVDAPLIEELPMALECRMKSYDEKTWIMVGEIVNVSIDKRILNKNGKVALTKFAPLIYDWMSKD